MKNTTLCHESPHLTKLHVKYVQTLRLEDVEWQSLHLYSQFDLYG